jgi:hypothetical protein
MLRRQAYEWRGIVPDNASPPVTLNLHPILSINPVIPAYNAAALAPVDIFVGGYGSNLDIPANVTASQFIVLDEISVWPPQASAQIWIQETLYFQNPDGTATRGVHGNTTPFTPTGGNLTQTVIPNPKAPLGIMPSYNLNDTPIYIKQGQTWGCYFYLNQLQQTQVCGKGIGTSTWNYAVSASPLPEEGDLWVPRVYLEFVLFDGADSIIAFKLMQQDMPVTVESVTAYKQMLIRHKLMSDIHEKKENEKKLAHIPERFI